MCRESKNIKEKRKSRTSTKPCEDYKKNPLTWGIGQRKLTCQQISEKRKCDDIWFKTNRPLWYVCQQSCNKCDKSLPIEDDPFLDDENRIQSSSTSAAEESVVPTQNLSEPECKDSKEDPLTWSLGHRNMTCQQISEKENCDLIWFKTNEPLWHVCQRSCNKCDETLSVEESFLIAV
jgi:hypothetical protein